MTERQRIKFAALFVEENGVYSEVPNCKLYHINNDARLYKGPWPVIAHPPCQRWGSLAYANYARWGGEHNKPGNDGGLFKFALDCVNKFGGVLEHPAYTRAWKKYRIRKPESSMWIRSGKGFVCEVWQSAYGHKATKKTWLYYSGACEPFDLNWLKVPGMYQIGGKDIKGYSDRPRLTKYEANATPLAFRDELIRLVTQER